MIRSCFFILTVLLCACDAKHSPSGDTSTDSGSNGKRDAGGAKNYGAGAGDADAAADGPGDKVVQDAGSHLSHVVDAGKDVDAGGRVPALDAGRDAGHDAGRDASSTAAGTYGALCESPNACTMQLTCINRLCTKSCASNGDCSGLSKTSRCVAGVCRDMCIDKRDCAGGLTCVMTVFGTTCMWP